MPSAEIAPPREGAPLKRLGSAASLPLSGSPVRLGPVNEFGIPATDEASEFFRDITGSLVRLYAIPRAEAVGRITRFWSGQSFLTRDATRSIQHQVPDQWARLIYFGRKGHSPDEDSWQPVPYSP